MSQSAIMEYERKGCGFSTPSHARGHVSDNDCENVLCILCVIGNVWWLLDILSGMLWLLLQSNYCVSIL